MKRIVVRTMVVADEALDEVLYRPAVVKAFSWLPRLWLCDLAKLSMRLDDRWQTNVWTELGPSGVCEACGRRAATTTYGGLEDDWPDGPADEVADDPIDHMPSVLDERAVHTCGWCHLVGPIFTEEDLARELAAARADSISWRWRWRVRP